MVQCNCSDYGKEGCNQVRNDIQMMRNKANVIKRFGVGNE
jgi:hypothetical protein